MRSLIIIQPAQVPVRGIISISIFVSLRNFLITVLSPSRNHKPIDALFFPYPHNFNVFAKGSCGLSDADLMLFDVALKGKDPYPHLSCSFSSSFSISIPFIAFPLIFCASLSACGSSN
jgi:hypothetical protein